MPGSLFDPIRIGTLELANRFVRSATWEGMCLPGGHPTPRLIELYRQLAAGGVGLIISGYTFIRPDGIQLPGKMGIHEDSLIAELRQLTAAVHQQGGRVWCQLVHAGGQTSSRAIGAVPIAPSAVQPPNYPEMPREMSPEEIRAVVEAFAAGARRAREAGFDGIQLHGAHGYLIHQFLSPLMNRRRDDYGGSPENRRRFLEEICQAVRREVGADYPVGIKLTAADHLPGGLEVAEATSVAAALPALGIDAIEVSAGTAASGDGAPVRQKIDSPEQEAYNAAYARQLRSVVDIPVMLVGGLRSCTVMQRLLDEGSSDLFALSRPLIREPALVTTWKRDPTHRATCISCNGCFKPGLKEGGIYCVIDRLEQENRAPRI